ncbi:MAG TPA: phosphopyruvate hydratase [Acidimicrobiales bacterium]|nr:phosphopyruvate hydratase [Acidimicrobiales bacterium]
MNIAEITGLLAWEALDSRGNPTVACEVRLRGGATAEAAVPSGASTGTHEALELRDGGTRYGGKGVRTAVGHVKDELAAAVVGRDASDQVGLDLALADADASPGFERLGANAVLAVSIASARAAAAASGLPLWQWLAGQDGAVPIMPMPMFNILSGGAHAARAVDVQDFLVVPVGASAFSEALEWGWRVRRAAVDVAGDRGLAATAALVADEGGLGLVLESNRAALQLLYESIERSGLVPGEQVAIALDVAATQLAVTGGAGTRYRLAAEGREIDASALVDELEAWVDAFPVVSIEDPLGEDDWAGWAEAGERLGSRVQLIGDDLFVTDVERLGQGVERSVANAVLVKPNQTGTLSRAKAVVDRAKEVGFATVVSARSGETEDAWLSDLAVGWGAGQIKVGSLTRSERTAKWNRLLRIEAEHPEMQFFRFGKRSS